MTTPVTIDEVIEELRHASGVILELGNVDEDEDDAIDWRDYRKTLNDLINRIRQHGIAQESREAVAWMHTDGRVVRAETMAGAIKDGGAILASLKDYATPLYTAPPNIQQLIGEIDEYLSGDGSFRTIYQTKAILDKYRGVK